MNKIVMFETIEESSEIRVEAEPYGSVTFRKESGLVTTSFHNDVPWEHFKKFFKLLDRAVKRCSRNNKFEDIGGDEDE
jgi:hypothetical protein